MPGIRPRREPGYEIELSEHVAHNAIGFTVGAQLIELGHHFAQRRFDVTDRAFRVVLALRVETPLAADELFAIEAG